MLKKITISCLTFISLLISLCQAEESRLLEVKVEKSHPIYDTSKFYEKINRKRRKTLNIEPKKKVEHPLWDGVRSIQGKSTDRVERKVIYPDYRMRRSNLLRPTPVSNNLQIYPFTASIPMEGSDLLTLKEFEFSWTQTFFNGELEGSSSTHQLKMDHWFFEQIFSFGIGLPGDTQFLVNMPLYHFNGDSTFTQNGFEMIALKNQTRNFWGAPSVSIKKLFYNNAYRNIRGLVNFWFQFPEGNQRAHGGSTSGHFSINTIIERMYDNKRYQLNFGLIEAGDLRLLNDQVLKQEQAFFIAFANTYKVSPTIAVEFQAHASRSALSYTKTKDLQKWFSYGTLGVRKHYKGLEASLSLLTGLKAMPSLGTTIDIRYRW